MLTIKLDDLKAALNTVLPAVGRNPTILENILLKLKGGWATLTANDGTREITAGLDCEGESLPMLLPAAKLKGIVANSGSAPNININYNSTTQTIGASVNRSRFSLASLPALDYPQLTRDDPTHDPELATVELTGDLLASDIKAVIDCVAVQDVRSYLNGLCVQLTEKHINLVATNGHLIGWIQREAEPKLTEGTATVILPRVTASDLTREKSTCQLTVRKKSLTADYNPLTTITSRLIDGRFPDYQQLFPDYDTLQPPIIIDREPLLNGLKCATVVAEKEKIYGVQLQFEGNRLTLTLQNSRNEDATTELTTETEVVTKQVIGLSVNYLITLLSHITSHQVALYLNTENTMLHLTPNPKPNGYSQRYAVMSMKI